MLTDLVSGGASCADPTAMDGNGTSSQTNNPIARLATALLGPKAGPAAKPPGSGDAAIASGSVLATGLASGQTPHLNLRNPQQRRAVSFAGPIVQQRAAQLSPFQEALHKYLHGALGAECDNDGLAQAAASLSPIEQTRLQNRVAIFSRQIFVDESGDFRASDSRSVEFLQLLNAPSTIPDGPNFVPINHWASEFRESRSALNNNDSWAEEYSKRSAQSSNGWAEEYYAAQSQTAIGGKMQIPDAWAEEFKDRSVVHTAWANEFVGQSQNKYPLELSAPTTSKDEAQILAEADSSNVHGGGELGVLSDGEAWTNEFIGRSDLPLKGQEKGHEHMSKATTARILNVIGQEADPKFRQSNFLSFIQDLHQGDIKIDGTSLKDRAGNRIESYNSSGGRAKVEELPQLDNPWVREFSDNHQGESSWASEYLEANDVSLSWANEFQHDVENDWATQFEEQNADARASSLLKQRQRKEYIFAQNNPYSSHPDPLNEAKALLGEGRIKQAIFAYEAALTRLSDSDKSKSDVWHALGQAHAENEDDAQALVAYDNALGVDPNNLKVLLSMGVSSHNELEQVEALNYMRKWITLHPNYMPIAKEHFGNIPEDEFLTVSSVANVFELAAKNNPLDGNVHAALGVLYNIASMQEQAEQAFHTAVQLNPKDASLWNKLGATRANGQKSASAVAAYRHALELKPNYVRAWSNMGISYTNMGQYEEAVRYFLRALELNGNEESLWVNIEFATQMGNFGSHIRDCASRRDIDALQRELSGASPLELK